MKFKHDELENLAQSQKEAGWVDLNGTKFFLGVGVNFHGDVDIGDGVRIGNGSRFYSDIRLGDNVIIGAGVDVGSGVNIGNYTELCASVDIGNDVNIGERVLIGAYTFVLRLSRG